MVKQNLFQQQLKSFILLEIGKFTKSCLQKELSISYNNELNIRINTFIIKTGVLNAKNN